MTRRRSASPQRGSVPRGRRSRYRKLIEAARLLLDTAAGLERVSLFEARRDPRNTASAAVARRLGFMFGATILEPATEPGKASETQVWVIVRTADMI